MNHKTYLVRSQFICLLALFFCFARITVADVVLDGSLSSNTPVLNSPNYTIEQDYGLQKGSNLFHSFSQFDLNSGEAATFKADAQIQNIIGRVTGGESSFINGTIATETASNANLWMINPAGWIFGEHAQLNVQGSFHISTADAITLNDGNRFFADPNIPSSLSIAGPLGYEFTQPSQATITLDHAILNLQEGKTLSFVGGDFSSQDAQLSSPVGQILIASNAGAGTWEIKDTGLKNSGQLLGNIEMSEQDNVFFDISLNVSDPEQIKGGGLVQLVAANTQLNNIRILAFSYGDSQGGTIQFSNSATLSLIDGSAVQTDVIDNGTGGTIVIDAENLILDQGSQINSNINLFSENGAGGQITLQVTDKIVLSDNSAIVSIAQGAGIGGNIDIQANTIELTDLAAIVTDTQHEANAGSINIIANNLSMKTGGTISSLTSDFSIFPPNLLTAGQGGDIDIQTSSLSLTDEGTLIASSSLSNGGIGVVGGGVGGNISLLTDNLTIANNAQVRADSTSNSAAGRINVINTSLFKIDNALLNTQASAADGGQISIQTETLALRNAQVTSSVEGLLGNGGNISVVADNLVMNTGFIQANTTTVGGLGGNIQIEGDKLLASSNHVIVGGDERKYQANSGINVIQAAAPDGISGEITLNTVQLDISGELASVDSKFSKPRNIADNPCLVARGIVPSSLLVTGQGALPLNASDTLDVSFVNYLKINNRDTPEIARHLSNVGIISPCS